jgi:hypothetical protein
LPFHIAGNPRVLLPLLALSIVVVTGLGALADYFSAKFLTIAASRILAEVRANLFVHPRQSFSFLPQPTQIRRAHYPYHL